MGLQICISGGILGFSVLLSLPSTNTKSISCAVRKASETLLEDKCSISVDVKGGDLNLDNRELQTMLMEDVNYDEEVEHHAGEDAALAQLIKIEQDARKVCQQARERVLSSNHTQHILLFVILL